MSEDTYIYKIREGLFAEIFRYKSGNKSTHRERLAVAYLFKVRKDLFAKKYGMYIYYGGPQERDYSLTLKFILPKWSKK